MALEISPNGHHFGECVIGNKASVPFTFAWTGDGEPQIQISTTSDGPGTFSVAPAGGKIPSEGTLRVAVVFNASGVGSVTGRLFVMVGSTFLGEVTLTGKGVLADSPDQQDGSHLLISVPDYGDTTYVNNTEAVAGGIDPRGLDGSSLHSYLRLGKFDYTRESPAAKELLNIIPKAGSAKDPRTITKTEPKVSIVDGVSGFIFNDDVRIRPQDEGLSETRGPMEVGDDPDHKLTKEQRRQESARLYARGGWRDHSDGNRISTTWGDKVEVVRGNYKMIVLGRQNDPGKAMGWEASGGHIQDYAPGTMPGASYWLEWIDDTRYYATGEGGDGRKGAWLLVNTTENVYQFARTAGTLREEKWGDVHESYIGSENPPVLSRSEDGGHGAAFAVDHEHGTGGHEPPVTLPGRKYLVKTPPNEEDQKGKIRSNPHIISKTWAERIDAHTGSQLRPVPIIVEKKWADSTESYTGDSDRRIEDAKSEMWAKKVEELTDVQHHLISNTRAGNIVEATTAGTISGATTAGNIAEITTAGVHTEVHLGGAHLEMEVGIFHGSLEIGLKGDIEIAGGYEVAIGSKTSIRFDDKALKFVNTQTDLNRVQLALTQTIQSLESKSANLEDTKYALTTSLKALSVHLGI